MAEYQNSIQTIYTHNIYRSKSNKGAIFPPISYCQPFHHLSLIPEVPLFPVLYPNVCDFVGTSTSSAKRSDGIS